MIHVARSTKAYPDGLRAYEIVIDGNVVGKVRRGKSIDIPVEPGHHEVWMKIDWARSPSIALDVARGQTAHLECAPNASALLLPLYLTIWKGKYVSLHTTEAHEVAG